MYFPLAVVAAIVLAILETNTAAVVGQVRPVTVTVYVTLIQTVAIPVPVTYYMTVASVATSFMTLTTTATSLGTVTLLNTVSLWHTVTTAAGGILGPMTSIFGQYGDLALVGGGVLGGVAVGLVSSSLIAAKLRGARLNESLLQFDKINQAILGARNSALDLMVGVQTLSDKRLVDYNEVTWTEDLVGESTGGGEATGGGGSSDEGVRDQGSPNTNFEDTSQKQKQLEEMLKKILEELEKAQQKNAHDLL